MEFSDITKNNTEKMMQLTNEDLVLGAYQYHNHQLGDAITAELIIRQLRALSGLNTSICSLNDTTTTYNRILIWLTAILALLTLGMLVNMFV